MRAISTFNREAGTSTFWCRACSALRTLVNMSATGSVNLICFSSRHPFAPHSAENLRRLAYQFLLLLYLCHPQRDDFRLAKSLLFPTRTISKRLEFPHAARARGNTGGTYRTCADTRAADRTACSGYAGAWKTWESFPCYCAPFQTSFRFWRPSLVLL